MKISKAFLYVKDKFVELGVAEVRGLEDVKIVPNGYEPIKWEMEEFSGVFTFTCLRRRKKKKHLFKKFRKYSYKTNRRK